MSYSANPFAAYDRANQTKNYRDQIVMLYMAAISYVQQAMEAIKVNNHAERYEMIDKAMTVMRGLRACLDFDANKDVAMALNNYYEALDNLFVSVQCEDNKAEICEQILKNLRIIKEAWENIDITSDAKPEGDAAPEGYESRDLRI